MSIQTKFLKCLLPVEHHMVLVMLSVVSQGLLWPGDCGLQHFAICSMTQMSFLLVHDLIYKARTMALCYIIVLVADKPGFHAREHLVVWVSAQCRQNYVVMNVNGIFENSHFVRILDVPVRFNWILLLIQYFIRYLFFTSQHHAVNFSFTALDGSIIFSKLFTVCFIHVLKWCLVLCSLGSVIFKTHVG